MSEAEQTGEAGKAEAPKTPAEIIRGRMPVAVVAQVRFGALKEKSTKELAEAFGTTVGKIDDIKKNRNFAYVTADYRPTEQHKADAIAWLKRHPKGATSYGPLVDEIESMPVATSAEAEAFEAVRVKARGQTPTTKEGKPANGGGGNRRGKKQDAATPAPSAEEVLS